MLNNKELQEIELQEIGLKETEYRNYIREHIANVQKVWKCVADSENLKLDDYYYHRIYYLVTEHDKSKYYDDEFYSYRRYFYPTESDKTNLEYHKKEFKYAWHYHQKRNPHHWEYWALIKYGGVIESLNMPLEYMVEMLCDWSGMSLKFNDLPSGFYQKNKSRMILSGKTHDYIERIIDIFDKAVQKMRE